MCNVTRLKAWLSEVVFNFPLALAPASEVAQASKIGTHAAQMRRLYQESLPRCSGEVECRVYETPWQTLAREGGRLFAESPHGVS